MAFRPSRIRTATSVSLRPASLRADPSGGRGAFTSLGWMPGRTDPFVTTRRARRRRSSVGSAPFPAVAPIRPRGTPVRPLTNPLGFRAQISPELAAPHACQPLSVGHAAKSCLDTGDCRGPRPERLVPRARRPTGPWERQAPYRSEGSRETVARSKNPIADRTSRVRPPRLIVAPRGFGLQSIPNIAIEPGIR